MKWGASIILLSILLAVCTACGQNQTVSTAEEETIVSAHESTPSPSSQGSDAVIPERDGAEKSQAAIESEEIVNPDLPENQDTGASDANLVQSLPEQNAETAKGEESAVSGNTIAVPDNDGLYAVHITVGNETFAAKFYDNATARVLIDQMPMTLDMRDYAGQEKVIDLSYAFPSADRQTPSTIRTGDLYLYAGSSLVLFYTTFSNSYSYVPIGYVVDTTGLASALGDGNVLVAFSTQ